MYTDDILYSFVKKINELYTGDLTLYIKKKNFLTGEALAENKNYINISLSPNAGSIIDIVGNKVASELNINIEMNYEIVEVFGRKKRDLEEVLKEGIERIELFTLSTSPATTLNKSFILYPEDVLDPIPILEESNQEIHLWRVSVTKFNS